MASATPQRRKLFLRLAIKAAALQEPSVFPLIGNGKTALRRREAWRERRTTKSSTLRRFHKEWSNMRIKTFEEFYVAELQELASVENQLGELLLEMAEAASSQALKDALAKHREQTLVHQERLETLLSQHRAKAEHTDQAMQALANETRKMAEIVEGNELRDAALIASAQKLEHYEISAYGTAAALAGQLNLRDDQKALHQTLEEKKKADAVLTQLAKGEVNPGASSASASSA
jgi:ferritin-like metal-binding protein YciE